MNTVWIAAHDFSACSEVAVRQAARDAVIEGARLVLLHALDPEATRNWAFIKAARATTNATSYMARFLPDLQERKADWDIVLKAMDDGQQLVDLVHQVALFAPAEEINRAEQAARSIFRARGFELTNDTMMMTQGLIGSLPMTLSPPFHADLSRM